MTTFDTIAYLQSLRHQVTEVRILRESPYLQLNGKGRGEFVGKTVFGYYDNENYDKLVADIQPYENDPETKGIYTTLQRCDPSLLARAENRLKQAGDNTTTSDGNITHFVAFPIDVDSGCATGISATDAELDASKLVAADIAKKLEELGIPMVKSISGNGWHILIYFDELLEVSEDTTVRFKRCGDILVNLWGGDATVYNPARVWKVYGTTAKKGDATADRPHRQAKIFEPTDLSTIERISFDDLEKAILSLEPTEPDTPSTSSTQTRRTNGKRLPPLDSRDDLERLARDCGAEPQGNWQQKPDYEACKTYCPLCNRDKCGVISYRSSGECGYKCHTNTCKGANFQTLYESAGYAKAPEPTKPINAESGSLGNVAPILPKLEPKKQSDAPVFPDEDGSLFPGCLEFLYNAYWGNNVFCKPFLLAMGLTAIGVCSGRKAFVTVGGDAKGARVDFPNFYTLILGNTTVAAKSDCRETLHKLLYAVDTFLPVTAIDSREGVAKDLRTDGEGVVNEWRDGDFTEGVRCLISFDEIRSLLVASRREVTGNIPAYLNDLWNCPRDASTRQKHNPIQVDYPVVNIFGCSTPDWLQKSVVGSDIDGGFINRFMPFLYERMPYVRNQTIKSEFYDVFVSMLRGFLTKPEGAKHYSFSDDAAESYHEWAERRYETALNDPVGAAITTRITDHARRIALAFALSTNADCDTKIALETWQTAQTVAEYLSDVAVYIFSEVGRDSDAVLEKKILDKLSELGNEAKTSEILASFASRERPAARVFHQIIEGLMRSDIVSLVSLKPNIIRRVG